MSRSHSLVWAIGSNTSLVQEQATFNFKFAETLGASLERGGFGLCSGESDLLIELARAYARSSANSISRHRHSVMIFGSLRAEPASELFGRLLGRTPSLAVVLGGNPHRGRVLEEAENARRCGIPLLAVTPTGGAAAEIPSTVETGLIETFSNRAANDQDRGDVGRAVMEVIRSSTGEGASPQG